MEATNHRAYCVFARCALLATRGLTFVVVLCGAVPPLQADPQRDINEFQQYFMQRFPGLSLDAYADGVRALPGFLPSAAANSTFTLDRSSYESDMESARSLWSQPLKSSETLRECFAKNPPATKYPYYDNIGRQIRSVELDINECLADNGEEPIDDLMHGKIAMLAAAFKEQFNGQPMAVEVDDSGAIAAYELGKHLYWAKRGQLNLSCADCHVHNAGARLRGQMLSAGVGHGVGYPTYGLSWGEQDNLWGTLHRRYAQCNIQVNASPFAAQSESYRALEFYEAVMNTGVPIRAPSYPP
ncbi:MAG: sulfur oxidation c-type cytochrome SoxA [Gammaproteobacteria bacterium]|nr:sulfur oxidation c-type cytochrome SoxA [Gammaproteobacteria bacterium]